VISQIKAINARPIPYSSSTLRTTWNDFPTAVAAFFIKMRREQQSAASVPQRWVKRSSGWEQKCEQKLGAVQFGSRDGPDKREIPHFAW